MALPWQAISAASVVAGLFLTLQQPVYSRGFFLGVFASTWLVLLLVWALYEVFLWPKLLSPLRSLPEPKGNHWLLGQWPRIAADPSGIPQLDWVTNIRNDGLIRYLGFFNQERVLVTSPKALAEVLVTKNYDFQKPSSIKWSIGRVLGIGVLLAEGDDHKMQRKNLMPAFAFRHVKDLYPVFWSKAREGVQALTEHVFAEAAAAAKGSPTSKALESGEKCATVVEQSAVIEANGWGSRITLDIIGVAGLGRDFGAVKDPTNPLTQTYGRIFKPSRQAQILALLGLLLPGPLVNALPFRRNEDIAAASAVIRATCRDLIHEKKDRLARGEPADADILSVALESGGFSDENLVDQMMTFLAAGHETTASAMTWAVYLLCLHPEVQSRLRAEVRERLPSPSSGAATSAEKNTGASSTDEADITALDVDRMPYLSAVCSEVLRYFSPVPLTLRQAVVDTTIAGQHVPKGTRIILCPWATNKDPALWGADAKEFRPDRWLATGAAAGMGGEAEDGKTDSRATASGGASSNYAFMTFLHGPRSCIGQGFAKAEFACILATWVGRFEFRLKNEEEYDESKVEIRGGVTARPAKGMHVHARVVEGW